MLLVEFARGIGHFGLDPDSEFDSVPVGHLYESVNPIWQLHLIDFPVSERGVVGESAVLLSEPAVVHHEEFAAHGGNVSHHTVHPFFVDVKVNAFPAVEQYAALHVAVGYLPVPAPAVEIAADAAQSLLREGVCEFRCGE